MHPRRFAQQEIPRWRTWVSIIACLSLAVYLYNFPHLYRFNPSLVLLSFPVMAWSMDAMVRQRRADWSWGLFHTGWLVILINVLLTIWDCGRVIALAPGPQHVVYNLEYMPCFFACVFWYVVPVLAVLLLFSRRSPSRFQWEILRIGLLTTVSVLFFFIFYGIWALSETRKQFLAFFWS